MAKLPDGPTLFLDRNLGRKLVISALRAQSISAVAHDDVFAIDAADTDWLPKVGERGWVVISCDSKITRNSSELTALIIANVHAFFVNVRNPTAAKYAKAIIDSYPSIHGVYRRQPPSIHTLNSNGRLSKFEGYDELIVKVRKIKTHENETLSKHPTVSDSGSPKN
jgi:hypothetical protein